MQDMDTSAFYNEKQKRAFILERYRTSSAIRSAVGTFRRIAPTEEKYGADLSLLPASALPEVIDSAFASRIDARSQRYIKNILCSYLQWCADRGISTAATVQDIREAAARYTPDEYTIRSPGHLQQCMDSIFRPESDETIDDVYRCFLWLLYGGMPGETAVTLTADDVMLKQMTAARGDDVAVLYGYAVPAFEHCMYLTQFRFSHPQYGQDIWKPRSPGNLLLRGCKTGTEITEKYFRLHLMRKINKGSSDVKLGAKHVEMCGMFYRMYTTELDNGVPPDFDSLAQESETGRLIIASDDTDQNKRKRIKEKSYELRISYERWKQSLPR